MGSASKVTSGAVWSILYNLLNAVYGFVAVPILINYFGKAEYGLIGLAQSVNVYMQLMDMGMNSTNVRFFSVWLSQRDDDKVRKLFQTSLGFYGIVGILNAVILVVISFFAHVLFPITPEQATVMRNLFYILAISAVLNWYSSCFDQLIRATENVAWIQKRSFIPKLLQVLVLVLTVCCHFSLILYFVLATAAMFAILPLSVSKIRREIPYVSFLPKIDKPVFKEILPYTLNIFSFNLFKFSFVYLCPIFLGIKASLESVTDYKIIYTIASAITMVTGVVLSALLPSASKVVAQGNREAYYKIAYQGTKYLSIITCLCVFGLITISDDLLTVYVGESYHNLSPWLCLLAALSLGNHIQCVSSLILSGVDIRALSRMVIVSSVCALVAAWFLIPYYQVGGVVIAEVVYEVMQTLFYYLYYMPKKMQISSLRMLGSFVPALLIGGLLCAVTYCLPRADNHWQNIFVFGGTFGVGYLLLSLLLLDKDDKDFLRGIIRHK